MEAKLKLGEGVRQQIRDYLVFLMYNSLELEYTAKLEDIGRQNRVDLNSPISFTYKCVAYNVVFARGKWVRPVQLRKEFWPMMEEILKDYRIVEDTEKPYVVGYFNSMLNSSESLDDFVKLCPNTLAQSLKGACGDLPSLPSELTVQQVEEFKISHKTSLDKVNYRALLNVVAY